LVRRGADTSRVRLAALALVALALTAAAPASTSTSKLPALPKGWPRTMQIGLMDSPDGAARLRRSARFGFRYQYLAGGANTGQGWSTWNPDGSFVTRYVAESRRAGIVPVFSYYMLLQSSPGGGDELHADLSNLRNLA